MTAKYKIEVKAKIPLPIQKVTGISWEDLVKLIADPENGISIAKAIRHHEVGTPTGTNHLSGEEMLKLWKAVDGKRNSN